MSEPTLTDRLAGVVTSYASTCPDTELIQFALRLSDVKRLAALLTADDERIAYNGHFDRAWDIWVANGSQSPCETWQVWWDGISARVSPATLDRLEAAYRAAVDQG